MLFLHPWLLWGLVAVSIPVIIHMMRRQAAKPMDWGAMRFLFDTISVRRRKMEWEDLLLMAARCLLLALAALVIARPFLAPDSQVPWLFVLPAGMLGIALMGASFVLSGRKARWISRGCALVLFLLAFGLGYWEKMLNLRRFEASGRRDVALIIDASSSMELTRAGKSVFTQSIEEAKKLVNEAPRGTAFIVVLGGPSPEAKTAAPLTHRADVLGVLDALQPIGGTFRAHEALGVATLALAQGHNTTKEIIVFTDSQRSGWRLDDPAAWNQITEAWKGLPTVPKLLLRSFGAPQQLRNAAVQECSTSRPVVGTDREVVLRVTVANTGDSMVTPGPVTLEVDQKKVGQNPIGQLLPGQQSVVEFRHRFSQPGAHVVRASMDAHDDLAADDHSEMVLEVQQRLPVLLIEGNAAGSFFERATGYTALALAPTSALVSGKAAGEKFLMDPRVVTAASLKSADLDEAKVILMADVARLPEALANKVLARVMSGAGLIVIAGPRCELSFYNQWAGLDGPLLPFALGEEKTDLVGLSPAPATFVHEALTMFAKRSDLSDAVIKRWRATAATREHGVQAAALANGDVFLATRLYGSGRVVLSTCAFDARSGNLPARRAFVPFIHEWVGWSAGGGMNWNVDSLWSPSVPLNQLGGGLAGSYYRTNDRSNDLLLQRADAMLDFDWSAQAPSQQMPREQWRASWKGSLIPPITGEYLFEAEVDDQLTMKLGDRNAWKASDKKKQLATVRLVAGVVEPVEIAYQQEWGTAYLRLYWTPPGGKRQLIPSMAMIPAVADQEPMRVIDPQGLPRQATIRAGRRGQDLSISGPAVPGVYQIHADQKLAEIAGVKVGATVPVAVRRDVNESTFTPMNDDDLAMIRSHADLVLPQSVADLLAVLQGKGFGREIARWLALAAVALLLLESVLARWVAKSRRSAEDVRVSFGEDTVWRGGIR